MVQFLSNTFGPNWTVKAWGAATALCAFIALNPKSVEFLPDSVESSVVGLASLLTGAGIFGMSAVSKGSKVTGGVVPSTIEAKNRIEDCKDNGACQATPPAKDEVIPRAIPVNPEDAVKYPEAPKPLFDLNDKKS